MQRTHYTVCLCAVLSLIVLFSMVRHHQPVATAISSARVLSVASSSAPPSASYGRLPIAFERNQGQVDRRVKFLSHGRGYNLFLTSDEAVITLNRATAMTRTRPSRDHTPSGRRSHTVGSSRSHADLRTTTSVVRMKLVDANPQAVVSGEEKLAGTVNYFIGNDPSQWRTGVETYSRISYKSIYPGIDLVYYGNRQQLEYDLVVAPGANLHRFRMAIRGAEHVSLTPEGDLKLHTAGGDVVQHAPVIYQQVNGVRKRVSGRLVLQQADSGTKEARIGFEVAAYDPHRPLVIDPVLVYSTYLGGSATNGEGNIGQSIAVDSCGNAYITGSTNSTDFPLENALQSVNHAPGSQDVFVSVINASGSALVYSTYLGGTTFDSGFGIAVDSYGNAYITGAACSIDFPMVNAYQPVHLAPVGDYDPFIARIGNYNWQTGCITVGSGGQSCICWNNTTNTVGLWNVNTSGTASNLKNCGPFSGYAAQAVAAGTDGLTRMLWHKNDGTAALWLLNADNTFNNGFNFGPYSGWSAVAVAVGSDNRSRLLWNSGDGMAGVWTVSNTGALFNLTNYGPYPGWTAVRIAAGSDGLTRLLWTKTDGSAAVWLLNADNSYNNGFTFSGAAGWNAVDITVGSDNRARLLWTNSDCTAGIWTVSNTGALFNLTNYGPFTGYTSTHIAAGTDGLTRLLWFNANGAQAISLLNSNNSSINGFTYGPY